MDSDCPFGIFKLFSRICWIVLNKYLIFLDQTILLHFSSSIDRPLNLPQYPGSNNYFNIPEENLTPRAPKKFNYLQKQVIYGCISLLEMNHEMYRDSVYNVLIYTIRRVNILILRVWLRLFNCKIH